jgi:Type II secretion system (T2SS), protein M subtype b
MNWSTLTTHDRRVLLLGAGSILGLVAIFRGIPAWLAWQRDAHAAAAQRVSAADQDAVLLAAFPAALDSLEARTTRLLTIRPALLTAESPEEASSNLAAALADMARRAQVRLDGVDVRVDSSGVTALVRASAEVQATADIAGLAALLRSVEHGPVLLSVRRLKVQPQNVASPPDQVESLSLRLTIEGLVLLRRRGAGTEIVHAGT